MKPVRLAVLMMILMAASIGPGVAGGEEGTMSAAPAASSPKQKGYFRRHLLHWVTAFGTSYADNLYEDQVGYSKDPLIFSDPPGIDRWVRHGLSKGPSENPVLLKRAWLGEAVALSAVIFSNLGREDAGRAIADDATGLVEVWFFDKGASGLVKNIVGRQRPEIEFIDEEEDLAPAEKEEEEAKRTNHQSFYSGATSSRFALMSYADAVVAGGVKSRRARVASFLGFYAYAAYIGYSRLETDRHYFTDVVVGAATGILIGRGFYNVHHKPERPDRRVTLRSVAPLRGGVCVLFSVRL